MSCNLILKIWKCNIRTIIKCNSPSNHILIFGKLFYIYKLIYIDLKPRILIASFLLAPLLNSSCSWSFCFIGLVFLRKKKKGIVLYWCFFPQSFFSILTKHINNGRIIKNQNELKPIYIRQSSGTILINIPEKKKKNYSNIVGSGKTSFRHSFF